MIVGKSGAGKSTLGNQLLNAGSEGEFVRFFQDGGGPAGVGTVCARETSRDGSLKVIDTPGIPDPSTRNTLKYFDAIVKETRGVGALNLLIFLAKEDRTTIQQFNHYKTLLKQFNYLPCEKLLVCRQPDYPHRGASDRQQEGKRNKGVQFVTEILELSSMEMPFMFCMDGVSDEAESRLKVILQYIRSCPSVASVDRSSLRTFAELRHFTRMLASRNDRLTVLKEESRAQRRAVERSQEWRDLFKMLGKVTETKTRTTLRTRGIGNAVAMPFVCVFDAKTKWARTALRRVERELATSSVDEGMLEKAENELRELEELADKC